MSILIDKNTRVMTQGITGKTGMFHTQTSRAYAGGKDAFVAGVNPKKAGENFEGIPIFGTVKDAKEKAGVNTSVIYVPKIGMPSKFSPAFFGFTPATNASLPPA